MNKRKGISLIVLIITIVVVIILAAAVILTMSKNNPIESAKKAKAAMIESNLLEQILLCEMNTLAFNTGSGRYEISKSLKDGGVISEDEAFSICLTGKFTRDGTEYKLGNIEDDDLGYVRGSMILNLDGINNSGSGHDNLSTIWKDLSVYKNNVVLNNFGNDSTSGWGEKNLMFDGVNDIAMTGSPLSFNGSKEMTIEFIDLNGTLQTNQKTCILFETSINPNKNYGSFYIDSNEYGKNDLCIANKYTIDQYRTNQKVVDELFQTGESAKYTIKFNTQNPYDTYTSMYKNNEKLLNIKNAHENSNGDITGEKIYNYELYIGSRLNTTFNAKMNLACLRIYNRDLTEEETNHNYKVDKARFGI